MWARRALLLGPEGPTVCSRRLQLSAEARKKPPIGRQFSSFIQIHCVTQLFSGWNPPIPFFLKQDLDQVVYFGKMKYRCSMAWKLLTLLYTQNCLFSPSISMNWSPCKFYWPAWTNIEDIEHDVEYYFGASSNTWKNVIYFQSYKLKLSMSHLFLYNIELVSNHGPTVKSYLQVKLQIYTYFSGTIPFG